MAQIIVTLEQIQHRDQRKYIFPSPIATTIGIGDSYTVTPSGSGSKLLDTLTNTEYTVSETVSVISAKIAAPAGMTFGDTPAVDAFARLRISEAENLFDSKQIFDNADDFWDDAEVSGSGTSSTYSKDNARSRMAVSNNTAGKRVRQTFMRFNYQSGKSHMIIMTGVLGTGESGITTELGYFDDDNGVFFRSDDGVLSIVMRSSATGSATDIVVAQADWNQDIMDGTGNSSVTLDMSKTQIFFIDMEWLGVGRVRYGFFHNGVPVYCHYMNHSNNISVVFMSTPNLPIRYSIENDGTGGALFIDHLCATVISEGGSKNLGILKTASTGGTHIDAAVENTKYALVGIKLKAGYIGATIELVSSSVAELTGSKDCEWGLDFNPSVAGSFTYSNETHSAIMSAKGATANTITGGETIMGGFASSAKRGGSENTTIPNARMLGSTISGTVDTIVLWARPIDGGVDLDFEGSITWREIS